MHFSAHNPYNIYYDSMYVPCTSRFKQNKEQRALSIYIGFNSNLGYNWSRRLDIAKIVRKTFLIFETVKSILLYNLQYYKGIILSYFSCLSKLSCCNRRTLLRYICKNPKLIY